MLSELDEFEKWLRERIALHKQRPQDFPGKDMAEVHEWDKITLMTLLHFRELYELKRV